MTSAAACIVQPLGRPEGVSTTTVQGRQVLKCLAALPVPQESFLHPFSPRLVKVMSSLTQLEELLYVVGKLVNYTHSTTMWRQVNYNEGLAFLFSLLFFPSADQAVVLLLDIIPLSVLIVRMLFLPLWTTLLLSALEFKASNRLDFFCYTF